LCLRGRPSERDSIFIYWSFGRTAQFIRPPAERAEVAPPAAVFARRRLLGPNRVQLPPPPPPPPIGQLVRGFMGKNSPV